MNCSKKTSNPLQRSYLNRKMKKRVSMKDINLTEDVPSIFIPQFNTKISNFGGSASKNRRKRNSQRRRQINTAKSFDGIRSDPLKMKFNQMMGKRARNDKEVSKVNSNSSSFGVTQTEVQSPTPIQSPSAQQMVQTPQIVNKEFNKNFYHQADNSSTKYKHNHQQGYLIPKTLYNPFFQVHKQNSLTRFASSMDHRCNISPTNSIAVLKKSKNKPRGCISNAHILNSKPNKRTKNLHKRVRNTVSSQKIVISDIASTTTKYLQSCKNFNLPSNIDFNGNNSNSNLQDTFSDVNKQLDSYSIKVDDITGENQNLKSRLEKIKSFLDLANKDNEKLKKELTLEKNSRKTLEREVLTKNDEIYGLKKLNKQLQVQLSFNRRKKSRRKVGISISGGVGGMSPKIRIESDKVVINNQKIEISQQFFGEKLKNKRKRRLESLAKEGLQKYLEECKIIENNSKSEASGFEEEGSKPHHHLRKSINSIDKSFSFRDKNSINKTRNTFSTLRGHKGASQLLQCFIRKRNKQQQQLLKNKS